MLVIFVTEITMARWLYTLFYYLMIPLVVVRLFYRSLKAPAYRRRVAERFGFFAKPSIKNSIWIHSVSVGETIAAAPLIKTLLQNYPDSPLVITTMTPTGSERVRVLFGDSVFHVYAPYDLPDAVSRFINRVQPKMLVIMETELWPNMINGCIKRGIPVILANARLSEKSAAGYQRFSSLAQPMLKQLTKVVAQSQADADRFLNLGMWTDQLEVSGSIKFDISLADEMKASAAELKSIWSNNGERLIVVAASTHEGEDQIILEAFMQLLSSASNDKPEPLLILVPRHPERFNRVAHLSKQLGLSTQRRSKDIHPQADCQVFIGDSMGELLMIYGCADIAIVGGSFVNNGGHNMLEPAAWGLPIITGDSDFNFLDISQKLQQQGALLKARDDQALTECLLGLIHSSEKRQVMGDSALKVMGENRGALKSLLGFIEEQL
jgi:3-deoxy-D-manno-octulosonic-acid transferase